MQKLRKWHLIVDKKGNSLAPHNFADAKYLPKKQQKAKTNIHPCIPIHRTTIGKHLIIKNAIIHDEQKQTVAPIDRI